MLNIDIIDWSEVDKICPEAVVMWDVSGGPEWVGKKSGPRIIIDNLREIIVVFVGDTTIEGDWDYSVYKYTKDKKWLIGRSLILSEQVA